MERGVLTTAATQLALPVSSLTRTLVIFIVYKSKYVNIMPMFKRTGDSWSYIPLKMSFKTVKAITDEKPANQ